MKSRSRAALVFILAALSAPDAHAQPRRALLGAAESIPLERQAPSEEGPLTLSQLQGGAVVIYLYGDGCSDCAEQLLYLQRLQQVASRGAQATIVAVAVTFPGAPRRLEPPPAGVIAVIDEGGKLWAELQRVRAVDSPQGARERFGRSLPLTLFVGAWGVRHHGSARMPMDRYVSRRLRLLPLLYGPRPRSPEIDIDDDFALQFGRWDVVRLPDGGTAQQP